MKPDRQSAKARLHSRMLLGLCRAGVLATATMATRLLRKAKTQSGTFTAARATSLTKALLSLIGITSCASRPQMLLFETAVIFSLKFRIDTSQRFTLKKIKKMIQINANLRTKTEFIQNLFANVLRINRI